jgi:hypothetical protein
MTRRLRTLGMLVAVGVVVCAVWAGVAAAAPGPCATEMPLADVAKGQLGEGWTVTEGTDPQQFDVEVLGVAHDLIGPGRDVIIVKISGATVDAGGGVWAGMSGSPVYIGGDLVGALAYGFSFGATDIAGLTPAEDMLRVNDLAVSPRIPAKLRLPARTVRSIAAKIGVAAPTVGGSLVRLKLPVSVSGVNAHRYVSVKKLLRRHGLRGFMLTPGSSLAPSLAAAVDDLVPGGNFAAALSYGDITAAGVGTTTYVCDGQALAFGHPLLFGGRTTLGAGSADAIAIVPDPLGPYKLANVTEAVGTLDQDRLAGVRAVDGAPDVIPVTAGVLSLDSEESRVGETDVVFKDAFPDLAFTHVFSDIDVVFDKIGAGSSSLSWTIDGTRQDGTPWEFHRANMYASDFDLSFESAFELYDELLQIAGFGNEKISFTSVDVSANVEETVRDYTLVKVLYCRNGSCVLRDRIRSRPGRTLSFRAVLRPSDGSPNQTENFKLTIPPHAKSGALVNVGAGSTSGGCAFGDCFSEGPATFEELLKSFKGLPNNVLFAKLHSGDDGKVRDHQNMPQDQVVLGSVQIPVFFPGQCCPPDVESSDSEGGFFIDFGKR